jgi:hypothetical protein
MGLGQGRPLFSTYRCRLIGNCVEVHAWLTGSGLHPHYPRRLRFGLAVQGVRLHPRLWFHSGHDACVQIVQLELACSAMRAAKR